MYAIRSYYVVFGYLAVHTDYQEAEDATFELLDDHKKLDLDMLIGSLLLKTTIQPILLCKLHMNMKKGIRKK